MPKTLVGTQAESGWAHSSAHERSRFSSPAQGVACYALIQRSGRTRLFSSYDRAMSARRFPSDAVVEIQDGDRL